MIPYLMESNMNESAPAQKPVIQVGTSGYSYEDWRGPFYPAELPSSKMLEYYSRHFTTVELNSTYYAIPRVSTFQRLAEKTPAHFEFIVKVNQETTHRRQENEKAIKQLLEVVKPIADQKKVHGFLAQFPYSFKNNEQSRHYLVQTKSMLGDYPLFVEFRNYTWLSSSLPDFLKENNIGYVNVDEPPLRGLLPKQDLVTNETGYVRLHGRNQQDWWNGEGSARYDYEYTEQELQEWLIHISNILKKTFKTYIFFNNHPTGKAVKNAEQMMAILKSI
jgi:uncharacterized protein YecE (DUF72 family)